MLIVFVVKITITFEILIETFYATRHENSAIIFLQVKQEKCFQKFLTFPLGIPLKFHSSLSDIPLSATTQFQDFLSLKVISFPRSHKFDINQSINFPFHCHIASFYRFRENCGMKIASHCVLIETLGV